MQTTQANSSTSLPNRLFFNETLNKALTQAKRQNKILALLLINIDHFQEITNSLDASQLDFLLTELGNRFTSILRTGDLVAHLGAGEFAVLLLDLEQPKLAAAVAEKILKASTLPFHLDSQTIQLTISIGICLFPDDGKTLEELQKGAARALDQAKNQGGKQYQFSQVQRTVEAQDYLTLHAALLKALEAKEFVLYYQPKLDLRTAKLSGLEALIRWDHPTLGLIDPMQFIPSAEESNLILALGEWALWEACHRNKAWQEEGYHPLSVAVNIAPKQFYHPQLKNTIKAVLEETALDPRYLVLELSEMTLFDNIPKVTQILQGLQTLKLSIALDDFGTGHTSMIDLKNFPLNSIKIDQSFIKPLPDDSKNAAFVTTLISFAQQLGMRVVAEGVETEMQMKFLKQAHCDEVQGYIISPPLPASKIVSLMYRKEDYKN